MRLIPQQASAATTIVLLAGAAILGGCGTAVPNASPTLSAVGVVMPNASLTPGGVLSTNSSEICVSGYAGRVRDVSSATKRQVYAEYGIASHAPNEYEVDHLIPLGIGGSNDIKNLWPQPTDPRPGRLEKDALEDELHNRICDGSLAVVTAQHEVAADWVAAYRKYVLPR